ncbi:MAG: peptidoglycan-binding protein [Pseudanabaena sp.]|jgi:peptidoglycan hydrolase-like protein with peptidoglycan-binding domain
MELLAYIQEEFIPTDDAIANDSDQSINLESAFLGWLKKLTTKSAKLSLNVILAGTTVLIGLGSTLSALAQVAPEQSVPIAVAPSADVKYVQSLLARNGFDPGGIDGVAGASTKNAIIRAQQTFGLTPDGVAGSQTISALENGGTSKPSSKTDASQSEATLPSSSTVMNLQKLLADRGFYNGAVDGIMGNQTRAAIVSAQRTYNLTADGVAGNQTLAALESDGNKGVVSSTTTSTNISISTSTVKSAEVASLQELLRKRGFYNGSVDGLMGTQTRLAIAEAQKNYGLATDGIPGTQTITALESGSSRVNIADKNSTATITDNTKNADTSNTPYKSVMALQDLLAKRGFYNGVVDGIKGTRTSGAIIAAQKAYGLTPDGIAGAQTLAALEKDAVKVAIAKSSSSPSNNPSANQTTRPAASVNDDGVANLQNLLADRGFYKGPVTGVLGTRTKEAIIAAQKAYGLNADGVAGSRTIAALESGAPRQQNEINNSAPAVTPTIRVIPTPQAPIQPITRPIAQPTLQPQIRVQPQAVVTPQPTVSVQPTPQVQVKTQETAKPQIQQPQVQPQVQPTTAAATPKPAATSVAVATPKPVPQATNQANVSDAQVLELQNLLAKRGFYNGKIDGALSGETRNAIIRAQNFYTISPADGSPSNKLADSLSKDTFISEGN